MAHPQNSPRGLFAKRQVRLGDASGNTVDLTNDANGVVVSGSQIRTSSAASALPGDVDVGAGLRLGENSTGHFIAINSTGTTWKYLNVTSKQPT